MAFIETNRFKPGEQAAFRVEAGASAESPPPTAASSSRRRSPACAQSGAAAIATRKPACCCSICIRHSQVQESLFDKRDDARRTALMRTIDSLNQRHGRDTVSFAAAGIRRPWKMQRGQPVAVLHDGLGGVAAGVRSLCCGLLN